jgi:hypothetical protein
VRELYVGLAWGLAWGATFAWAWFRRDEARAVFLPGRGIMEIDRVVARITGMKLHRVMIAMDREAGRAEILAKLLAAGKPRGIALRCDGQWFCALDGVEVAHEDVLGAVTEAWMRALATLEETGGRR